MTHHSILCKEQPKLSTHRYLTQQVGHYGACMCATSVSAGSPARVLYLWACVLRVSSMSVNFSRFGNELKSAYEDVISDSSDTK